MDYDLIHCKFYLTELLQHAWATRVRKMSGKMRTMDAGALKAGFILF